MRNISIDYEIQAPADAYLHAGSGSGNSHRRWCRRERKAGHRLRNIHATGLQEASFVHTGSGSIDAEQVGDGDVKARNRLRLHRSQRRNLHGALKRKTGSGSVRRRNARGAWRSPPGPAVSRSGPAPLPSRSTLDPAREGPSDREIDTQGTEDHPPHMGQDRRWWARRARQYGIRQHSHPWLYPTANPSPEGQSAELHHPS